MKDYRIKYEIDQSRLQNIWREVSQIEKALDIRRKEQTIRTLP